MMLLIQGQKYLINKVEQACQSQGEDPYDFFGMHNDGLPSDMPMAANTKMLFTAYYLYDEITDKTNIVNEFSILSEKRAFEYVKQHVLENCNMLERTTRYRKTELGKIVFDKICKQLRNDIESYSENM